MSEHDEDFEGIHQIVTGLMETMRTMSGDIGEVRGELKAIREICTRIDGKTGFNWTTFLATVIVPLAGLIVTAYIAVRIGAPQALPGGSP